MVSTWTGSCPCLKEASSVSGDNGGFMEVLWKIWSYCEQLCNIRSDSKKSPPSVERLEMIRNKHKP